MSDPDPDRHWGDRRVKDGLQQLRLHQLFQHRLSELKSEKLNRFGMLNG